MHKSQELLEETVTNYDPNELLMRKGGLAAVAARAMVPPSFANLFFSIAALGFVMTCQAQVPSQGAKFTAVLPIAGKEYSLPPGEWQVLATRDGFSTMGGVDRKGATYRVYLVQVDAERRLVGALQYNTSLTSAAGIPYWNEDPCRRTDTIYRDTLDGNTKFPACFMINHTMNNFWRGGVPSDPYWGKIWTWLHENKIEVPYTAIRSDYSKFFSGDFLVATAWFNPDLAGVRPDRHVSWSESPWHPKLIENDPERVAYIESVKTWGKTFVASARDSFMGSKRASIRLPELPGLKKNDLAQRSGAAKQ